MGWEDSDLYARDVRLMSFEVVSFFSFFFFLKTKARRKGTLDENYYTYASLRDAQPVYCV